MTPQCFVAFGFVDSGINFTMTGITKDFCGRYNHATLTN